MKRVALAAGVALLVSAGCGERTEPTGTLALYPVTVRGLGEAPAVVTEPPDRVVALDPGSAELVAALGHADRLVGVPAAYSGERAEGAAIVAERSGQVDVEAATAARPDLVVTSPSEDALDAQSVAEETDAGLYVQPDRFVSDVERAIVELGFLLGEPVEARRLAARVRNDVAGVEADVRNAEPVRVFVDAGFFVTVPPRSLTADLVRRARGVSVTGKRPRSDAYALCQIARLRPSVFVRLTEPGEPNPGRPRFENCEDGPHDVRYVELPAELVTRAGPRVPTAFAAVVRALHPDVS